MRYDISTSDWESQTFYTLEGPALSTEEWYSLWKKAVIDASKKMHKEYGYMDGEFLVKHTVDMLIEKYGFSRSAGDHDLNFNFAGESLKDVANLGEHIPPELLPKDRRLRHK